MSEKKNAPGTRPGGGPKKSAWKSPALMIAVLVTLLGVGMWAYAAQTNPPAPVAPPASSSEAAHGAAPDGMVSGFSASGTSEAGSSGGAAAQPRLIDKASPAVTRFGACFVAGFCIAYAFKKFIKVAAIITGVVLIGMFAMARAGIIDFDWSMVEGPMNRSVAWIQGEAGALKDFILGYLPAAGSAVAGMVVGFRRG